MRKSTQYQVDVRKRLISPSVVAALCFVLLNLNTLPAKAVNAENASDTAVEKKVDYLERIYFSGENKAGLNAKILVALQEIEVLQPTPALAKQATFLLDIKDKASALDNACDVLEMLAVGIYNLDAAEAEQQGIKMPSDKAKANAADAVSSLNRLSSTTHSMSNSASNLAWSSYLLSGGRYTGFGAGAARFAGKAGAVAGTAAAVGQTVETGRQLSGLASSVFGKKDKPCKDVPVKAIQVGQRTAYSQAAAPGATVPKGAASEEATAKTVISIVKVSAGQLRELADALKTKTGVNMVEKAFDADMSTITVVHSGSTDALSDWIEDNFGKKYKTVGYSSGKINLALR